LKWKTFNISHLQNISIIKIFYRFNFPKVGTEKIVKGAIVLNETSLKIGLKNHEKKEIPLKKSHIEL